MDLNLSALATKLAKDKWMLTTAAHSNLTATVLMLQSNPKLIVSPVHPEFVVEDSQATGDTTVIFVNGVLVKGCSQEEEEVLGLSNTDFISQALDDAAQDATVTSIAMVFNSPGGQSTGIEELGRKIAQINLSKPVYGWTETMSASASYWLMSQCKVLGMAPSASVGSIGVYSIIDDLTEALKQAGVHKEAIYSGKFKLLGADFRALTDEEKTILQADVSAQHTKFKEAVLSKREIDPSYMEGLTYEGDTALAANLVDIVVDSLPQFLTTADTYTQSTFMNKVTKISKQATVATPTMAMSDAIPGVKPEAKAEDTKPDAKPEELEDTDTVVDDKSMVECPHCKGLGKLQEAPEAKEEDKAPEAKPEAKAEAPEAKPEDKPEPKVEKKATMPSIEEWNAAFNRPTVQANAFTKAAYAHIAASQLK